LVRLVFGIVHYEKIITEQYHAADSMPAAHMAQRCCIYLASREAKVKSCKHIVSFPSASDRTGERDDIKHCN